MPRSRNNSYGSGKLPLDPRGSGGSSEFFTDLARALQKRDIEAGRNERRINREIKDALDQKEEVKKVMNRKKIGFYVIGTILLIIFYKITSFTHSHVYDNVGDSLSNFVAILRNPIYLLVVVLALSLVVGLIVYVKFKPKIANDDDYYSDEEGEDEDF